MIGAHSFWFAQGNGFRHHHRFCYGQVAQWSPTPRSRILDLATNTPRETKTNAEGDYRVFGLSAWRIQGNRVRAQHGNDSGHRYSDRRQRCGQRRCGAESGSATKTLEVTAEAPLVNTDDQTISDTINSREVIDLPRDSRNVYSFLYLNPNITQSGTDGSFKFLGAQSYGANFSLDGQRSNGGIFGEPTSSQPSLEAVGDINVLSNDFSAEYAGIANIRVTTKRGGSGYHGSMFYNNKNSALAAWTLQDKIGKARFAPYPVQSNIPIPISILTTLVARSAARFQA